MIMMSMGNISIDPGHLEDRGGHYLAVTSPNRRERTDGRLHHACMHARSRELCDHEKKGSQVFLALALAECCEMRDEAS